MIRSRLTQQPQMEDSSSLYSLAICNVGNNHRSSTLPPWHDENLFWLSSAFRRAVKTVSIERAEIKGRDEVKELCDLSCAGVPRVLMIPF